jgi:Na+/serine symporter
LLEALLTRAWGGAGGSSLVLVPVGCSLFVSADAVTVALLMCTGKERKRAKW